MAIVLSNQENIDLLLVLIKWAIALCTITLALFILFWLRLKKLENRLYLSRKHLKSRFVKRMPQKTQVASQVLAKRPIKDVATTRKRSPETQVYCSNLSTSNPYTKSLKKLPKRSGNLRWRWLLAILIASITGTAIALMQLGNSFISPEFTPFIWLLIGVMLLVSATVVETA